MVTPAAGTNSKSPRGCQQSPSPLQTIRAVAPVAVTAIALPPTNTANAIFPNKCIANSFVSDDVCRNARLRTRFRSGRPIFSNRLHQLGFAGREGDFQYRRAWPLAYRRARGLATNGGARGATDRA